LHQDLTEYKRSEDKIREKDIQFRKLSANVPDLIFQFTRKPDGSYCVPIASQGIRNIFGCSPEDVLDDFTPIGKVIYPEDAARVISDIEYSAKHLTYFTCEFRVQIPGKPIQWIFSRSSPEQLPDGSITWYGFNVDITQKKETELDLINIKEKVEEREAQFRLIFENSIDTIIWTEAKTGKIIACNQACQTLTEYSRQEILGQSFSILLQPEKSENIIFDYYQHQQNGGYTSLEFPIITKSGKAKYIELSGTNIEINGTEICQGIFKDITNRIEREHELTLTKERAEESDKLKSAFLANMSHEIRTPMNGILGFAELLREEKLTGEEQKEYISIIQKSGARMLNIINDIIDISKIESGQVHANIKESNINEQIEYIFTFFKPEAEAKGIQLLFVNTLLLKESIIKTDREKVFAILTNLVKNAIKYSDKGPIEIGYLVKGEYLEFFVKDAGIGIAGDRQEAIFERFIQADIEDKRAYQGAGLGLAISKAYVEMLGGKIWVESEVGKGSSFYFTLPYNYKIEEEVPTEKDDSGTENDINDKKLTILIAEDDDISEKLIYIAIRMIGKEVFKVKTGTEAVDACRNNPEIDLILMDIQMPEMNGYEATRQIREFNKDVIIIAQTAFGLSGDREKAIKAGCNDYISKPINKVALTGLIQKYF
jgi:PAS domain S-box-containing protein